MARFSEHEPQKVRNMYGVPCTVSLTADNEGREFIHVFFDNDELPLSEPIHHFYLMYGKEFFSQYFFEKSYKNMNKSEILFISNINDFIASNEIQAVELFLDTLVTYKNIK